MRRAQPPRQCGGGVASILLAYQKIGIFFPIFWYNIPKIDMCQEQRVRFRQGVLRGDWLPRYEYSCTLPTHGCTDFVLTSFAVISPHML